MLISEKLDIKTIKHPYTRRLDISVLKSEKGRITVNVFMKNMSGILGKIITYILENVF